MFAVAFHLAQIGQAPLPGPLQERRKQLVRELAWLGAEEPEL